MKILKIEFSKSSIERDYKVVDDLAQQLRYFKRQPIGIRKQIYECSKIEEYEANTVVYNQGDLGDFMCIIIKGKVRLSKRHQFFKDIQKMEGTINDGDEFG